MEPLLLRDGRETTDPRLDLLPEPSVERFERRLSNYAAEELLAGAPALPRGKTYRKGPILDQGREGACVGFSLLTEAAADPVPLREGVEDLQARAMRVYHRAQELDPWPETRPGGQGGTSVDAGGLAAVEDGLFEEFRWTDSVEGLIRILRSSASSGEDEFGPAIVAVEWRDGMYEAPGGMVDISGSLVGYHAIAVLGVNYTLHGKRIDDDPLLVWPNTWGLDYGIGGVARIRASALAEILGPLPEIMVPVRRKR